MHMNKKELRERFKTVRNHLHLKKERSFDMVSSLLDHKKVLASKVISVFVSFGNEIDTLPLISKLFETKKRVVVPWIAKNDEMIMKEIKSFGDLTEENRYGIKEPKKECKAICKEEIDLMIVPGLAFDKKGYRLGYGKGYYDKFLRNTSISTIGIGFKEQFIETLPIDEFDVPLNEIELF